MSTSPYLPCGHNRWENCPCARKAKRDARLASEAEQQPAYTPERRERIVAMWVRDLNIGRRLPEVSTDEERAMINDAHERYARIVKRES